jgi:hypothetical protein
VAGPPMVWVMGGEAGGGEQERERSILQPCVNMGWWTCPVRASIGMLVKKRIRF